MASPSSNFLDLPNELQHRIYRYLSFSDLLHLILTSRRFRDLLISDMYIWRPLQYELFLSPDSNQNIVRINSLMLSPLLSFCTRLRIIKFSDNTTKICIPTYFFTNILSTISHQLRELCLLHLSNYAYRVYSQTDSQNIKEYLDYNNTSPCSRYL